MPDIYDMPVDGDTNIPNCKDRTKCLDKEKKSKSLKNLKMPSFKPSSDIRISFKTNRESKKTSCSRKWRQSTQ